VNKEFLNRVVGRLVKETRVDFTKGMDFTKGRVYTPYLLLYLFLLPTTSPIPRHHSLPSPPLLFYEHCENLYALNNEEIDYVWKEYKDIILDKING